MAYSFTSGTCWTYKTYYQNIVIIWDTRLINYFANVFGDQTTPFETFKEVVWAINHLRAVFFSLTRSRQLQTFLSTAWFVLMWIEIVIPRGTIYPGWNIYKLQSFQACRSRDDLLEFDAGDKSRPFWKFRSDAYHNIRYDIFATCSLSIFFLIRWWL